MRTVVFALVCALFYVPNAAAEDLSLCRTSPKLVAACFKVHGRLSLTNGSWNYRIWPVGSRRLLAVVDSRDRFDESKPPPLPPAVLDRLDFETDVFADFEVCPLRPERAGAMRHVCVAEASRVFGQKR